MPTEPLHSSDFAQHLHSIFQFHDPSGQRIALKLVGVEEKNLSERTEQFSLFFFGPVSPVLRQQIYSLSHEKLGEMTMFLVPHGPEENAMSYEVVFNRMRGRASA